MEGDGSRGGRARVWKERGLGGLQGGKQRRRGRMWKAEGTGEGIERHRLWEVPGWKRGGGREGVEAEGGGRETGVEAHLARRVTELGVQGTAHPILQLAGPQCLPKNSLGVPGQGQGTPAEQGPTHTAVALHASRLQKGVHLECLHTL